MFDSGKGMLDSGKRMLDGVEGMLDCGLRMSGSNKEAPGSNKAITGSKNGISGGRKGISGSKKGMFSRKPAGKWDEAFPVGNGTMGVLAMGDPLNSIQMGFVNNGKKAQNRFLRNIFRGYHVYLLQKIIFTEQAATHNM